jgi:hypothetical protein
MDSKTTFLIIDHDAPVGKLLTGASLLSKDRIAAPSLFFSYSTTRSLVSSIRLAQIWT